LNEIVKYVLGQTPNYRGDVVKIFNDYEDD